MHHLQFIIFRFLLIKNIHSQVTFESVCSTEATATGLTSLDGNDEFEIDLNEAKFLPDDRILRKKRKHNSFSFYLLNIILFLVSIKQKRQNYGISEFVLRAFDGDNVIGKFDDQATGNLPLRHQSCPNGASV